MNVVFCITTLLAMTHMGTSVTCPHPFLSVGSGCYYIPPETNIDWINAFAICSLDYNGYLAEITDQQEQANIVGLIRRTDPKSLFNYYIGATDSQQAMNFRWMTSGNYMVYSNWLANQPDNDAQGQNCAHLWNDNDLYKWNDIPCNTRLFGKTPFKAVCEANPVELVNTCLRSTHCCTNSITGLSAGICGKLDDKLAQHKDIPDPIRH